MPESAAYSRRSFGKTAKPTSLSSPIDGGATTISLVDASTWPDGSGGPFMFTQDRGLSTEERIECPTRVGNLLQNCVRGADGTTPQSHGMTVNGAEITSTARDYDEANAHIASTTLDHHTQYARTDGTRAFTGRIDVSAASGTTAAAGTGIGDKVALFSAGAAGFGLGVQTDTLVAYVPANKFFAVRAANGSGNASSGNNGGTIDTNGTYRAVAGELRAGNDRGGELGFTTITNTTAIGNGAGTNLQSPAKGTGGGPATLTAQSWLKFYLGTTAVYIPAFV